MGVTSGSYRINEAGKGAESNKHSRLRVILTLNINADSSDVSRKKKSPPSGCSIAINKNHRA